MFKSVVRGGVAIAGLVAFSGAAYAAPTLQLGILGGTYNTDTETIVASTDPFTLVAILTVNGNASVTDALAMDYFISAALTPKTPEPGGSFGTFTFDGDTISATSEMDFGTPPLDAVYGGEYGDLGSHGIFATYFSQFQFNFSANRTLNCNVNTQDNPGLTGCNLGGAGGTQYYTTFNVSTDLLTDYFLHFDLYNANLECLAKQKIDGTRVCTTEALQIDDFAPFSHDAASGGDGGDDPDPLPEPGSLALLGLGLLSLGMSRRRKI